jgi:FKBP-type peptidyl-prolyl cis-trans isomerase
VRVRVAVPIATVLAALAAGCPKPLPKTQGGSLISGDPIANDGGTTKPADPTPTKTTPPPAPPATAQKLAGDVIKEVLAPGGGGASATGNDRVTVRYRSWAPGLELGDLQPFVGEVPRLPTGISEAVATMSAGERARIWVPAVDIKGNDAEPVVIDIELVSIQAAPPVPTNLGKPPKEAKKSSAGVSSVVLAKGTGTVRPTPFDEVVVGFTAWGDDGTQLETTVWDYTPTRTWQVNWFGTGMQDAITQMVVGEKTRFWMPMNMSNYNDGSEGWVTYDIHLVEVHTRVQPPPTPKDVKKPPKSAKKTKLGTRYKFLKRGKGKDHPSGTNRVQVKYTGWTTDGRMFDSTVSYGYTPVFTMDSVIPGWADVLKLMAPGDQLRAWIPEELAYKDRYGGPKGMLVYDLELVAIEP